MPFKFKDLVVDIVAEGAGEQLRCPQLTICANFTCGFVTPWCNWPTKWGCGWRTPCGFISPDPCRWGSCGISPIDPCGAISPVCGGGSLTPTIFEQITPTIVQQPGVEQLSVLKQQLQQQLSQIEEMERTQAEAARPQSLQEAEDLERRLKSALEEVQAMKRNLK